MKIIDVNAERDYQVIFERPWLEELAGFIDLGRCAIIAPNSIVERLPSELNSAPLIKVPDGEEQKSIKIFEQVLDAIQALGMDRSGIIVGIGGGATTDLAGYVAASYLRGLSWVAIPTTIAGMVDAAVGGKTGLNLTGGKNLVGAFHSPIRVIIDQGWLDSLPIRDRNAGLAEAVKCGFIADPVILDLFKADQLPLGEIIYRAVAVKAKVVSSDFRESYEREALNYGHTLGHAIERHSKYELRHGEAIAIGMIYAAHLSHEFAGLSAQSLDMHREILGMLQLPDSYPSQAWPELYRLMSSDKKRRAGAIRFVTLPRIGLTDRNESLGEAELKSIYQKSVAR